MNIDNALQQLSNASGAMESAIYDFYRKAMEIASECSTSEEKKAIWVDARGYTTNTSMRTGPILSDLQKRKSALYRFWNFVNKNVASGCWEWTGALFTGGYGRFFDGFRQVTAHRWIYQQINSTVLPYNILVCHTCDNVKCVNLSHLFLGNHSDNAVDCVNKGRHNKPKGEAHPRAKLCEEDVREIRATFAKHHRGLTRMLARKFGVTDRIIFLVRTGQLWKHIT